MTAGWRWGWPLSLLAMAAVVPLLVWLGWVAISNSSDGTVVNTPLDPAEPGYEAFVDPTPTLLLIHANGDRLGGVTLLVLTDPGVEGAVLMVAPETATASGPLSDRWAASGSAGVADAVAELFGIRPSDSQVVGDGGWAALAAAVSPVAFTNPVALVAADGQTRYEAGPVTLAAADVGPYLAGRSPDESPLDGLSRQASFWEAWLEQVGESAEPHAVPGETDRGMGRFVPALVAGRFLVTPVQGQVTDAGAVLLDAEQAASLVHEAIPFPISAAVPSPPRVRLLDGVGDPSLSTAAARVLSRAGAQITRIGNAAEFGWETTRVTYHDPDFAPAARAYRDVLGTGTVIADDLPDTAIDITVTFGADFSHLLAGGG